MVNKRGKRKEAMKAYFIIVNLILATIAFSWIVGAQAEGVGIEPSVPLRDGYYTQGGKIYDWSGSVVTDSKTIKELTVSTPSTNLPITSSIAGGTTTSSANFIDIGSMSGIEGPVKSGILKVTEYDSAKQTLTGTLENGQKVTLSHIPKEFDMSKYTLSEGQISQLQSTYWGQTVKLADGQERIIADAIKNSANFNDPNLLKALDAKSITQDGGKIIIDRGGGAKTIIENGKITTTEKGTSWLSRALGAPGGMAMDALLTGVIWAAGAYAIGQLIGSFAGMEKEQTKALSTALAAGSFTWKFLGTLEKGKTYTFLNNLKLGLTTHPLAWGLGVAVVTFVLLYKKESKEIVTFSCKPWQAPVGGSDCEKCNKVAGCSDYKCRSLGQACQLLNQGTTDEKCTWVNPKDVSSPIISLWNEVLTKGYKYVPDTAIRPPARGFKIVKTSGDECVKAFTPLEFGIITNEPAQCRIDYNHTLKFDDMTFWFGESNLYLYNHSQRLSLPSPASVQAAAPELQNDGTYTLYIRCKDANGNANVDEFAMRFCVEKGPDTTPPKIEGTSIMNGMPVKYNQSSVDLEVYVNEPSDCKWSREDRSYDNMENLMTCSKNVWEMNNNLVYTCKTTLTGIKDRTDNVFYFRCKDQPWANESSRNVNMQSYKFTLIGTEPLNIIDVKPNGTIKGSTDVVSVWLEVETANGYKNGEAKCYYGETGNEADWIEFFETGTSLHKQRLDLVAGSYKYYVKCVDLGGNRDDNSTVFKVEVDRQAPVIARVYKENELLKIITTEDSECRYSTQSCNFKFEDGVDMPYANQTSHVAEWKTDNTYYIRCADEYGNMPVSNTCSIIVRPYDVVEQKVEE